MPFLVVGGKEIESLCFGVKFKIKPKDSQK